MWTSSWSSGRREDGPGGALVGARLTRGLAALLLGALMASPAGSAERPFIAAHRGGALLWPENSLMAFRGALDLGVDLVELDAHLTKDGEAEVIHDATLDRTTTGRGAVADHTWAALAEVRLGGTAGERIPRLREVLEVVGASRVGLLLEIKRRAHGGRYPGIEDTVLRLLGEAGLLPRTTIMAFGWGSLERLRALSPTVRLAGLLDRRTAERLGGVGPAIEQLRGLGANELGIERVLLSPGTVGRARARGLGIGVWTVNEADDLRRALGSGVDYVTTDRPDLALALRRAR